VRDVYTDDLLYNNAFDFPQEVVPELEPAVHFTAKTNYLYRSITNQQWLSFKETSAPLDIYLYLNDFNAFFYNDYGVVVFGNGFVVDDVIAHEWSHGYTLYTSGLIYSYQSGAINEAMSDM
jgi:Zn-dependent metalloprotease